TLATDAFDYPLETAVAMASDAARYDLQRRAAAKQKSETPAAPSPHPDGDKARETGTQSSSPSTTPALHPSDTPTPHQSHSSPVQPNPTKNEAGGNLDTPEPAKPHPIPATGQNKQ